MANEGWHGVASFHFEVEWEADGQQSSDDRALPACAMGYWEGMKPGTAALRDTKPGGYLLWKWDAMNDFSRFGGVTEENIHWQGQQKCGHKNVFTYSDQPMYKAAVAAAVANSQLVILASASTQTGYSRECPDAPSCCALLLVDYATHAISVSGPVCGPFCSRTPEALLTNAPWVEPRGSMVIDAQATFQKWSKDAKATPALRGKANATPWQLANRPNPMNPGLTGAGEAGRCVE